MCLEQEFQKLIVEEKNPPPTFVWMLYTINQSPRQPEGKNKCVNLPGQSTGQDLHPAVSRGDSIVSTRKAIPSGIYKRSSESIESGLFVACAFLDRLTADWPTDSVNDPHIQYDAFLGRRPSGGWRFVHEHSSRLLYWSGLWLVLGGTRALVLCRRLASSAMKIRTCRPGSNSRYWSAMSGQSQTGFDIFLSQAGGCEIPYKINPLYSSILNFWDAPRPRQ